MMDFNLECIYCTAEDTCVLGHQLCNLKCLDFEPEYEDYLGTNSTDDGYKYDAYDYFDDYLDDKDDGLIPPDYEL